MAWTTSESKFGSLVRGPKPAVAWNPRVTQYENIDDWHVKKTTWEFGPVVQLLWDPRCKIHKIPKIQHISKPKIHQLTCKINMLLLDFASWRWTTFYVRKLRPQLASRSLLQWLVLGSMYERPLRGRWILTGNLWKPAWRVMIHFVNIDKDLVLGRKTSHDSFARVARDHRSLLTNVLCIFPAGWAGSSP